MKPYSLLCFLVLSAAETSRPVSASAPPPQQQATQNILFVMTDGLRWQELFSGADEALMNKENGNVADAAALRKAYWRTTPEERRAALMPFFWSTIAKQGQVFGDPSRQCIVSVTNGLNFSYPGYNEVLTGYPDPRIDSNDKKPNPNVTVLEWLHRKEAYRGKVAAFSAWDVFPSIFNRERCGFPVNSGYEPFTAGPATPKIELLNILKRETPRKWEEEPFDAIPFHTAMEYLRVKKPRILFVSLGETDDWAHEGNYAEYLHAANRADLYLKTLWETVQKMPQYRGKTSLVFTTDHGRGGAPTGWKGHGKSVSGSDRIWFAVMGPDTPAAGIRENLAGLTQGQAAATVAALLGENYNAFAAAAAPPYPGVMRQTARSNGMQSAQFRRRVRRASTR
jgi:hypothetical protein